jgi:hypothetical protein
MTFISDAPTDVSYYVLCLFKLNTLYALYYVNQLQNGWMYVQKYGPNKLTSQVKCKALKEKCSLREMNLFLTIKGFFWVGVTTSNFLPKMSAAFGQEEYSDCWVLVTRCTVVACSHTHTHTHTQTQQCKYLR